MKAVVSGHAIGRVSRHDRRMLIETYIEALLVDEDLADQVWELWDAGVFTDDWRRGHMVGDCGSVDKIFRPKESETAYIQPLAEVTQAVSRHTISCFQPTTVND